MKRLIILSVIIASILYSKEDNVIVSINGLESAGLSKRYINYAQYTIQEISIDLEETVSKMIGDKYSINIHFTAYEAVENTINVARDSLNIIIKTVKDKYPDEDLVTHSISHPYKGIQGVIIGKVQIQVNIDNSIDLNKSSEIFDWVFMDLQDCRECISFNNVDMDSINGKNTILLTRDDIYDDSWAVIIGIDKYKYSDQLNYAVKDAEAVKDMLISKFDFPEKNIRYLTDEEATLSNIKLALDDISSSADANDRVLVFYSGHGETEQNNDGTETGYIIPVEGRQDKPYATGLAMDEILRTCQMSNAKHMLFLMDACYSGLMTENVKGISTPQVEGYLSKVANEKARQIITAGGGDEQVIERDEWQHSAFTKNLIEGFDTWEADYNKDGCITADELSTYLRENVTEDSDFQQTPQDGRFRNSGGGEFVFFGTRDTQIEAEVSLIKEKQVEDAKDEQSINKYKYQITASTTLESLALGKKSERQLKSGGILAVSGFLFFIDTGSSSSNNILKVVGVIGSGIGILYNLAIKSKAEKKYNSIKDIDNKDEKEGLAYNHLVFLADEAKRNRQYKMVTHGAISAYSLINGTEKRDEWGDELRSNSSLYNGLLNGALAWYHYKVLSKEEKALENYSNQP